MELLSVVGTRFRRGIDLIVLLVVIYVQARLAFFILASKPDIFDHSNGPTARMARRLGRPVVSSILDTVGSSDGPILSAAPTVRYRRELRRSVIVGSSDRLTPCYLLSCPTK